MKTNKNKTPLAILAFAAIALMGTGLVVAYPGFGFTSEDRTAIQEAIENDDYETWRSLMEAQLSEENFNQLRERHMEMQEMHEQRAEKTAIEAAIEAGDYEAWVAAMGDDPMTDKITEENFTTLVEFYEARQNGDFETAKTLAEELGIEGFRGMFGNKFGRGCMHEDLAQ
jgi:hypothetical protein